MRRNRVFSVAGALMIVLAAVIGGASVTDTDLGLDRADPVGEADACGGICLVGVGVAAGVAIGLAADVFDEPETNTSALNAADAQETHVNIYEESAIQRQNNQIIRDSQSNYLQDGMTIATLEAKNEYVRYATNSSESKANTEATQRNLDWWAAREMQLLNQWKTSVYTFRAGWHAANSSANLSRSEVYSPLNPDGSENTDAALQNLNGDKAIRNYTVTLVNDSTVTIPTIIVSEYVSTNSDNQVIGPYGTLNDGSGESGSTYGKNWSVQIDSAGSGYEAKVLVDSQKYNARLREIRRRASDVNARVDSFINTTYPQIQDGAINKSDLVDPYLAAREYSPSENYGTWNLRTMQSLGVDTPKNLSQFREMDVVHDGTEDTGVLLSDGVPAGGFEVGKTYNASNITGSQFLMHDGTTEELTGTFSISAVYGTDGEKLNKTTVEYRQINYTTSNTEEFKNLLDELQKTQAQLDARQQNLRGGSGGPAFFGSQNGMIVALIAALFGGALVAKGQNGQNGGGRSRRRRR